VTISHSEVEEALRRSGYLLEYKIERILRSRGYFVQANQMYPDPLTGKQRELDLAVIGAEHVGPGKLEFLFPVLLIECVNNPEPIAFFTKTPVAPKAQVYDIVFSGVPVKVRRNGQPKKGWTYVADFLRMSDFHHYCTGRIATQYCSFSEKKSGNKSGVAKEWMASHDDNHFGSFQKLCSALNHDVDKHFSNARLRGKEDTNLQLYYPVVVVSGDLLDVRPGKKRILIRSAKHIHFVQSFISQGEERQYHLDVVTEGYFPAFLSRIDREVTRTVRALRRRRKDVRYSIDAITKSVQGLRSPAAIRKRLEL